jgi:oligoendopeptidase F
MNDSNNWDLEKLLPISKFNEKISDLKSKLDSFRNKTKKLTPLVSKSNFIELIKDQEEIIEDLTIIYFRADLAEATDTSNTKFKQMVAHAKDLIVYANDVLRPFDLWLKGRHKINGEILDEANAKRLFKAIPTLEYFFTNERTKAKYALDDKVESIITRKDITGASTLVDLRDLIESKQEYHVEIDGKTEKFDNIAQLAPYFHSPKRAIRKNAYDSLIKQYNNNRIEYFLIYQALVKDWNNEKDLRGYSSAIAIRNIENGIKNEAVEGLIKACDENINIFRDFFKLKAKYLKLEKFDRYDIYAAVNGHSSEIIELDNAKQLIIENYGRLDPQFDSLVKKILNSNTIDYLPRKNKKGGGFCAPISPNTTPYIFLNYTGIKRDFMTLAHEMGHALHSLLSNGNSILTYNAPLILAETGSTLGEMINFDNMLLKSNSQEEQISMLFEKISDIYATIIRQIYFVKFELQAHKMIVAGCSIEDLDNAYLANLNSQFANSVLVPDVFKHEWMYIPHIVHTPFYCYAYAFGELLGLCLYEDYLENNDKGLKEIKGILESGSSKDPALLLKQYGYDLENGEIWNKGFEYIKKMLLKLKGLI